MEKIKFITFGTLLLALIALDAHAVPKKWKVPCEEKLNSFLVDANDNQWIRVVSSTPGFVAYRTPSKNLGIWYEIEWSDKYKRAKIIKVNEKETVTTSFTEGCKINTKVGQWLTAAQNEEPKNIFTDADLKALMSDKAAGVIYVWTPGMLYSSRFLNQFKSVVDKKKWRFTSILSANSNLRSAREVAAEKKFSFNPKKLNSVELTMRSASSHYPKLFVYNNGKLALTPIIGVLDNKELNKRLDEVMRGLK